MSSRRARQTLMLLHGLALVPACTLDEGQPFAVIRPVLDARLDQPADRMAGGGWQKLSSGFEVRFTRALMEVPRIDLLAAPSITMLSFDLANPPAGYSNCHNGHCHHTSGRLVPYEEIEEELAGAGSAPKPPVASLSVGELDLLTGATRSLACTPSCDLPLGRVGRLRAPVAKVLFEGEVRDGLTMAALPGLVRWRADVSFAAAGAGMPELAGAVDLPADRRHDPRVDLALELRPGPAILDGVDWAKVVVVDGTADFQAPGNAASWDKVRVGILETPIRVQVVRGSL